VIRKLKFRAQVLHDGEIRTWLTLEFGPTREFWLAQVVRHLPGLLSRPKAIAAANRDGKRTRK
jgi:hypothetical protein